MIQSEGTCSWRMWDEQLTLLKLQRRFATLGSQRTEASKEQPMGDFGLKGPEQPDLDIAEDLNHVELVNVDLTPQMLEQIV